MMSVRFALLLPLAVLLGGATAAREMSDKAKRAVYQARSLAMCQVALVQGQAGGFEPGDISQGCRCTIDSFMAGKTLAQLPPIESANFRTTVKDELALCLDRMKKIGAKRQVDEAAGVKLAPGSEPDTRPATTVAAPPPPVPGAAPAQAPTDDGSSAGSTVGAWLAVVPLWLWGLVALAFLLFIARRLAPGDGRRDLTGVPRSMRSGSAVQPRRPDLPRN